MSKKSSKKLSTLNKQMTNANANPVNGELCVDSTTNHLFIDKNNAWFKLNKKLHKI